ncbi:hypothetical protein Mal64_10840 [Pseudobythopirellula maris]|uniref:CheY-P phosphatase CheC n=1 Tax=Pseudobythopirellula maris TaxID=2527991 RepID=A0A5C5ZT50_9BACT|nr:hypothetical protein [Pseudobythopirellula maris]TWT90689.1 hypothetical protein Mal64_10840 [Pseudobythopirellula maris]
MSLSPSQIDALTEAVSIGVGRSACSLSDMIDRWVHLHTPSLSVCNPGGLCDALDSDGGPYDTAVVLEFAGEINGRAMLAFSQQSGAELARIFGNQVQRDSGPGIDQSAILEEIGNVVLNGVLGSIANLFEIGFAYQTPCIRTAAHAYDMMALKCPLQATCSRFCMVSDAVFEVAQSEISGSLMLSFCAGELATRLDGLQLTVE